MFENIFSLFRCPNCSKQINLSKVTIYDASQKNLQTKILFGIAQCQCAQYPIVQGILYLERKNRKKAINLIKNGQFSKSVDCLFDLPKGIAKLTKWFKPWGKIDRNLMRIGLGTEGLFRRNEWVLSLMEFLPNSRPWAHYLKNRLKNPTFVNSLVGLSLLKRGYSLDVASGFGHFIPFFENKIGKGNVIAIDKSFWNLYFSSIKNRTASHICFNLERGIPFKDDAINNLTLNDCFHCFLKKRKLVDELKRILEKRGVISISHVHNYKSGPNFVGKPIKFSRFEKLFKNLYVFALPEKFLHHELVIQGKIFSLNELSQYNEEIPKSPSYNTFIFKNQPNNRKLYLMEKYKKTICGSLDYSEDKWLKN